MVSRYGTTGASGAAEFIWASNQRRVKNSEWQAAAMPSTLVLRARASPSRSSAFTDISTMLKCWASSSAASPASHSIVNGSAKAELSESAKTAP